MADQIPWHALRIICDGASIIDTTKLELRDEGEAYKFVLTYGYDLFNADQSTQIWKIFEEACDFIDLQLCPSGLVVPKELRSCARFIDFRKLLLHVSGVPQSEWASKPQFDLWICAVLRVMHVLSHYVNDFRLRFLPEIQRQTVDRFAAHIQNDDNGKLVLGYEKDKIPLEHFEIKQEKSRERTLMKILRKKEIVAQQIYDHVGVRFVVQDRIDCIRVVQYLVEHHLIAYPNVIPSRSRNSLMNICDLEKVFKKTGTDWESIRPVEDSIPFPTKEKDPDNPFSSDEFRAIQFTYRPLVRLAAIAGVGEPSFFFPVEVQILDLTSYNRTLEGAASHEVYQEKQLEAVRGRVLRGLVK